MTDLISSLAGPAAGIFGLSVVGAAAVALIDLLIIRRRLDRRVRVAEETLTRRWLASTPSLSVSRIPLPREYGEAVQSKRREFLGDHVRTFLYFDPAPIIELHEQIEDDWQPVALKKEGATAINADCSRKGGTGVSWSRGVFSRI